MKQRLLSRTGGLALCLVFAVISPERLAEGTATQDDTAREAKQLLRSGIQALDEGRLDDAHVALKRAMELEPEAPEMTFQMGRCFLAMAEEFAADPELGGDPGSTFFDAAQFFSTTLEREPGHSRAGLLLAKALYLNGDLEGARESIEAFVARFPRQSEGLVEAGRIALSIYTAMGQAEGASLAAAETYLQRAIEVDPAGTEAHRLLGDCRLHGGNTTGALDAYQEGIARRPGDAELHQRLVTCFQGSEAFSAAEAVGFYQALLKGRDLSKADEATLWWYQGTWHDIGGSSAFGAERFEQALEEYAASAASYRRCGEVHPIYEESARSQEAQAFANMGWAALRAEEYDLSEAKFGRALYLETGLENAVLGIDYLGDALIRAQGLAAGRDLFGRAARANPWNARWWNNYALFGRETGYFESAYTSYVKAAALEPGDTRYINDCGMMLLYYLHREPEKAEAYFREAWRVGEETCSSPFITEAEHKHHFEAYCDAMLNLGRLLLLQGEVERCEPIARALREKAPRRPDVIQLQLALKKTKEGQPYMLPE